MKKGFNILIGVLLVMAIQIAHVTQIHAIDIMPEGISGCCTHNQHAQAAVPKIVSVKQIAPNQLEVMYNSVVDPIKATTVTNYWIQDTQNVKPKGIGTLGKKETVGASNALTADKATITQVEGNDTRYVITFSQDIGKGEEYKLTVCYVTAPNQPPYSGDNGTLTFIGK